MWHSFSKLLYYNTRRGDDGQVRGDLNQLLNWGEQDDLTQHIDWGEWVDLHQHIDWGERQQTFQQAQTLGKPRGFWLFPMIPRLPRDLRQGTRSRTRAGPGTVTFTYIHSTTVVNFSISRERWCADHRRILYNKKFPRNHLRKVLFRVWKTSFCAFVAWGKIKTLNSVSGPAKK